MPLSFSGVVEVIIFVACLLWNYASVFLFVTFIVYFDIQHRRCRLHSVSDHNSL